MLYRIIKKLLFLFQRLFLDKDEKAFVRHSRATWKSSASLSSGEVLVEENVVASSVVAISYVANVLARKHDAAIKVYSKRKPWLLPWSMRRIYRSFGARFLFYSESGVRAEAEALFADIYPTINNKRDVERLSVEGVPIGDLIYDTHLRNHLIPTIDITGDPFRQTLLEGLCLYLYWKRYFARHNVKAVIVSHCVYAWNAIILRVAVHRSIPVYQATAQRLYYITKSHNYRAYNNFLDYPSRFSELDDQAKADARSTAKERIDLRFSGKVGVDMHYSTKSAYTMDEQAERVVAEGPRVKILIATHCFFDSPHPYGINLFPDFYEWLMFLGRVSEQTDYDWYIKTHPDFLPGNIEVINDFLKRFPKFKLIASDTSHHQLIREGIDCALTVYGTIGFEYAAQGVTVVNASMCNPHVAYDFNLHPETVEEYEAILHDLKNRKATIDIDKVYEYYYCRFLDTFDDWLFQDYQTFIHDIGGHSRQVGSISYRYFLEHLSQEEHRSILHSVETFIASGDYCLMRKHRYKGGEAA